MHDPNDQRFWPDRASSSTPTVAAASGDPDSEIEEDPFCPYVPSFGIPPSTTSNSIPPAELSRDATSAAASPSRRRSASSPRPWGRNGNDPLLDRHPPRRARYPHPAERRHACHHRPRRASLYMSSPPDEGWTHDRLKAKAESLAVLTSDGATPISGPTLVGSTEAWRAQPPPPRPFTTTPRGYSPTPNRRVSIDNLGQFHQPLHSACTERTAPHTRFHRHHRTLPRHRALCRASASLPGTCTQENPGRAPQQPRGGHHTRPRG